MTRAKKIQHDVSIRLHTSTVEKYEDVLKPEFKESGNCAAIKTPVNKKFGTGVAFSLVKQTSTPNWARDFNEMVGKKLDIPDSEYSKAVIVLEVTTRANEKRFMSIAFGYGDSMLDSSKYESDFGRNIAAQKVPDTRVLSAGTLQISDAIIQMEKQYTGTRDGGIKQLITSQSEFPSSISGTWRNGAIETKLEGRGSLLKAKRIMNLNELLDDLKFYLDIYLDPSKMADWATRLTQLGSTDSILKAELDKQLMLEMIDKEIEYGIAWPYYRSLDDLSVCLLKKMEMLSPVEQLQGYIQKKKDAGDFSAKQLLNKIKSTDLIATDADGKRRKVKLYSGLSADMFKNENRYLLFNGKWYKVSKDFYINLEEKIKSVPVFEKKLPELGIEMVNGGDKVHYKNEGTYNEELASFIENGMLFDKVNFNNKKGGKFQGLEEPADVITPLGEMFFVKKGDSSAALSHLFLQGLVSAKLLARDGDGKFREFINKYSGLTKPIFTNTMTNSDVTLIFTIIKNNQKLPFFSMISFSEVLDSLTEMGYKVKIAWVTMKK